jgi:Flp pilus assembly pilin Flp
LNLLTLDVWRVLSVRSERGATPVEYGLILACVAVFFIGALSLMGVFTDVFDSAACNEARGYTCEPTP